MLNYKYSKKKEFSFYNVFLKDNVIFYNFDFLHLIQVIKNKTSSFFSDFFLIKPFSFISKFFFLKTVLKKFYFYKFKENFYKTIFLRNFYFYKLKKKNIKRRKIIKFKNYFKFFGPFFIQDLHKNKNLNINKFFFNFSLKFFMLKKSLSLNKLRLSFLFFYFSKKLKSLEFFTKNKFFVKNYFKKDSLQKNNFIFFNIL